MVEKDSDQAELVLISLRTLIEEMHTMPKNKAKIAINNIIDESSKTLFPYIYYQLNKFYMLYTQLKQSNDNPEALKLSVAMIKACLKLLISLCEVDWMPLGYVILDWDFGTQSHICLESSIKKLGRISLMP